MPPNPLGSGQSSPRIGKVLRPAQRQSGFSGLALQHGVHRPIARSRWQAAGRNVGVSLKWQLNHMKPVSDEDCISVLSDVAERAKEVIPVQHCSRAIYALPFVDLAHLRSVPALDIELRSL